MAGRQSKKSGISLKEYRKRLRKLQRAGLVSSRVDAAHHKPTSYMRAQLRKYDDVISGKAKTLQTNTRSTAEQLAREYGQIKRKGKTLIVPTPPNTEKVSFDLRTRKIKMKRKVRGKSRTTELLPRDESGNIKRIPQLKKGQVYTIRFAQHGSISFDSFEHLAAFMARYEKQQGGTWDDWKDYIEIIDMAA